MQLLHELALAGKLSRIKGRSTQDKGSLRTGEKHLLRHVAKANSFGRDQSAKRKAIQGCLKLLLR
jgi:hypothetical protein